MTYVGLIIGHSLCVNMLVRNINIFMTHCGLKILKSEDGVSSVILLKGQRN